MTARDEDLRQLTELLEEHASELSEGELEAFTNMRAVLLAWPDADGHRQLSGKQREWLRGVYDRFVPQYENLVSSGKVPRGREVETPAVLKVLPKKPPVQRRSDDE
jgi:hypothetical protein